MSCRFVLELKYVPPQNFKNVCTPKIEKNTYLIYKCCLVYYVYIIITPQNRICPTLFKMKPKLVLLKKYPTN